MSGQFGLKLTLQKDIHHIPRDEGGEKKDDQGHPDENGNHGQQSFEKILSHYLSSQAFFRFTREHWGNGT